MEDEIGKSRAIHQFGVRLPIQSRMEYDVAHDLLDLRDLASATSRGEKK
jgi:hypothetical protein